MPPTPATHREGPLDAWRALTPGARAAASAGLAFASAGIAVRLLAADQEPAWQALLTLATALPMAIAVSAGVVSGRERGAWLAVAAGLLLTGVAASQGMPTAPGGAVPPTEPGFGDALWLARYPFLYGGLAVLVAARSPTFGVGQVLDGLVGAFAAAALFALIALPWMVDGATISDATVNLRAAYPLLDVLVVGFLAGAAALNAWPARVWLTLGADIVLFVVCMVVDTHAALAHPGEPLTGATHPWYIASAWFLAVAAFSLQAGPARIEQPRRPIAPSLVLGGVAVATLVGSAATGTAEPAVWLAAASLVATLGRQAMTLRDNARLLVLTQAEAATDPLTGLGNRRSLTAQLETAAAEASLERPMTLALFDLDGFKVYNDTFGHAAGDALLERLGAALAHAVHPAGGAFRVGGDEFCVLLSATGDHAGVVVAARVALAERGRGFAIGASGGVAVVPRDAHGAAEALRLADQRMYAEKATGRGRTAGQQATAALLQVVRERDPELGEHTRGVAGWAADVARALGAGAELVEQARLGGELHDVGKTAIPDAILAKPGPLDDEEWQFMRRHTVIGERILLADPALAAIAPAARSHHERWDGGGYPDGLAGRDIPLVARIVAVCDAFEAMISDRPYRPGRSHAEAIDELVRCRGDHFDPAVVEAFVDVVRPGVALASMG